MLTCKPLTFKITTLDYYGDHPNYPDTRLQGFMSGRPCRRYAMKEACPKKVDLSGR